MAQISWESQLPFLYTGVLLSLFAMAAAALNSEIVTAGVRRHSGISKAMKLLLRQL